MNNINCKLFNYDDDFDANNYTTLINPIDKDYDNDNLNVWQDIPLTLNSHNQNNITDERCAKIINYDFNYSIKYISTIADFYGLKKKNLNKNQIITAIVDFEMDSNNFSLVENRKRLFNNIVELKNHPFFKKCISGNHFNL